jgi:hypothetical protein
MNTQAKNPHGQDELNKHYKFIKGTTYTIGKAGTTVHSELKTVSGQDF